MLLITFFKFPNQMPLTCMILFHFSDVMVMVAMLFNMILAVNRSFTKESSNNENNNN